MGRSRRSKWNYLLSSATSRAATNERQRWRQRFPDWTQVFCIANSYFLRFMFCLMFNNLSCYFQILLHWPRLGMGMLCSECEIFMFKNMTFPLQVVAFTGRRQWMLVRQTSDGNWNVFACSSKHRLLFMKGWMLMFVHGLR